MRMLRVGMLLVFAGALLILVLAASSDEAEGKSWYVDDDPGADFERIQDAVDAAEDGDTIRVYEGTYYENVVVNKSVSLIGNGSDVTTIDGGHSGDVVTITADGCELSGFMVRNSGNLFNEGIHIGSDYNRIFENNCTKNKYGIYSLDYSGNNTIYNNTCDSNNYIGICLYYSNQNTLSNNTCSSNNDDGIYLLGSDSNTLSNNTCSLNNRYGIYLEQSDSNTLSNNTCSNNNYDGIFLGRSDHTTLTDNQMIENGIFISGNLKNYWNTHTIDTTNTVNGKPVYYYKNSMGITVPYGAGQVILANCTWIKVENQNCSNGSVGILVVYSSNITIMNNNCSNNCYHGIGLWYSEHNTLSNNNCPSNVEGIFLGYSDNNTLSNNNCPSNVEGIVLWYSEHNTLSNNNCNSNTEEGIICYKSSDNSITNNNCSSNNNGIYLSYSSSNIIHLNNFIDNTYNVYSDDSTNIWNSTEKITYTYNGSTYTNYLGNYWDDYTDDDNDDDGIWDNPYIIDEDNNDSYPLIEPFENYFPKNQPPEIPSTPSGPSSGYTETLYSYSTSTTDPDGDKIKYIFYWDDGNGSWTELVDSGTAVNKSHSWDSPGTYYVKVKAEDEHGLESNWSDELVVNIGAPNQPPIATFTYSPQTPLINQEITFNASLSHDPDGEIVSYNWNFGDDSTGEGKIVTHSYSSGGSHTVRLTVTDNDSATDNITKTVIVSPEGLLDVPFFSQRDPAWCDKKLDHSPCSIGDYGCALTSAAMVSKYFGYDTDPDRLNTSLTEVGGLDEYGILHWPKVEEASDGKVEWIEWAEGSWDRIDQELSESNPVIANVSFSSSNHFIVFIGKIGAEYYFLDPYDESRIVNKWPNGAHGEYSLNNLRIYHGASENQPPIANAGENLIVFSGDLVYFDGSNSYDPDLDGTIVSYRWDFGDGSTAEGKTVTHRFRGAQNEPKEYTVNLAIEDDDGAIDTDAAFVTVKPLRKLVDVGPGYFGVSCWMEATYNWVGTDEATGENLYIVSKIETYSGGISGAYQLFILRRTSPPPSIPELVWHIPLPTAPILRTYVTPFAPSVWQKLWGKPAEITTLTFQEGTFQGIGVTDTSLMVIVATGTETGITLYYDAGITKFESTSPVVRLKPEELKEMWELRDIMDLLNKIIGIIGSPGEIRIYDSEGHVTGLVNSEIKEEIPGSAYSNGTILILYPNETYRYEVKGIDEGTYGLTVTSIEDGNITNLTATNIPTSKSEVHTFSIDWDALSQGEKGVTITIDKNGDGQVDHTIRSDATFTKEEYDTAMKDDGKEHKEDSDDRTFMFILAGAVITVILIVVIGISIKRSGIKKEGRSQYPPLQVSPPFKQAVGTWICPGCGTRVEEKFIFCPNCGSRKGG